MLTANFLNRTRRRWMYWLTNFQYNIGGTWYPATITAREISGDALRITTMSTDDIAGTVTGIRIYDNNGDLVLSATENITKKATQGILTVWEFPLYEV